MGVRSHFGADLHAEFLLYTVEPGQTSLANAFETSGLRAGLPNASAEEFHALLLQLGSGVHHLFFGFGRAGARNHHGALVIVFS